LRGDGFKEVENLNDIANEGREQKFSRRRAK